MELTDSYVINFPKPTGFDKKSLSLPPYPNKEEGIRELKKRFILNVLPIYEKISQNNPEKRVKNHVMRNLANVFFSRWEPGYNGKNGSFLKWAMRQLPDNLFSIKEFGENSYYEYNYLDYYSNCTFDPFFDIHSFYERHQYSKSTVGTKHFLSFIGIVDDIITKVLIGKGSSTPNVEITSPRGEILTISSEEEFNEACKSMGIYGSDCEDQVSLCLNSKLQTWGVNTASFLDCIPRSFKFSEDELELINKYLGGGEDSPVYTSLYLDQILSNLIFISLYVDTNFIITVENNNVKLIQS